jgi:signal transduction histidine kinase
LEEKNERLEQFASMVSHDLHNPIAIASGYLELYRESGEESDLEMVETSIDRIEDLVTDLTALARQGRPSERHEVVSLHDVARDAWELIDTRSATLTTDPCTVTGDASQLQALFENLFRNAVGYGGDDVSIRVGPLEDGFYVEDTGVGIPPDKRDAVFDHGYTTGTSGSGIGLTIVSRIAQAHDWDITLTDSQEGGARFEFRTGGSPGPADT